MKISVEIIEALLYKLCMFGVPIDGSTNIFCDNRAVCVNTTHPQWTLPKKHHGIAYHPAQETVAVGTVRGPKEHTSIHFADRFAKTMEAPKRELLMENFMY